MDKLKPEVREALNELSFYAYAEEGSGDVDIWRETVEAELHRLTAELEKIKAQVQRRDLLLQSLTPGGSEYVNDPERCAAYAQKVKRDQHEHIVQVTKRAKEAEAERDALREILKQHNEECRRLCAINKCGWNKIHGQCQNCPLDWTIPYPSFDKARIVPEQEGSS